MLSFSYRLTMLLIKLKGVKRAFSKSPLNIEHLRKEDIHMPFSKLLQENATCTFKIRQSTVTELTPADTTSSDFLIIYCPGGAFISGPTELNWSTISQIVRNTRIKAWLIDYPKAPETTVEEIAANIEDVYSQALKSYKPSNIILIGDSAGGNLILTLVQRLIEAGEPCPAKIIAISPVLDASMSNPEIECIEKNDPILSKSGVLAASKMAAGTTSLRSPIISPLYGSFRNFPETHFFIAENDIMAPDQRLAISKMKQEGVKVQVTEGKKMPHIWPLMPVMSEARIALTEIEEIIENTVHKQYKLYETVPA
jgi:acetyl esterase/lipase